MLTPPSISAVSAAILALSIAHLRLNRSEHQRRIQEYAKARLEQLRDLPGPDSIQAVKGLEYYQQLEALAGIENKVGWKSLGWKRRAFYFIFRRELDRRFSEITAIISTISLVFGSWNPAGISVSTVPFFVLSALLVCSVSLVLFSENIVSVSHKMIDKNYIELKKVTQLQVERSKLKDASQ